MKQYSKEDYASSNGMMTAIWGPGMWHFLHTISFNYPIQPTKEEKKHYEAYINSIRFVLPCRYCRDNYANNLKNAGWKRGVLKSRDTFSRFMYRLHNAVNRQLGKRCDLSYEAVRDRYEGYRSRCMTPQEIKKIVKKTKETGCIHPLYGESRRAIITIKRKSECRGRRHSISESNSCRRSASRQKWRSSKN